MFFLPAALGDCSVDLVGNALEQYKSSHSQVQHCHVLLMSDVWMMLDRK
jgi:hypothetical protein